MSKLGRTKAMLYGLLLVGAVIGLLIDRLRATEMTDTVTPLRQGPAQSSVMAACTAQLSVKGPAIARVFDLANTTASESQPADSTPVRNAFVMTPRMHNVYEEASPAKKTEQARQAESEEDQRRKELDHFQSAHKLKGTSLRDGAAWALIDGRVVRIGERIDGFELKRVERYRAELVKNGLTATLTLPLPY